MGKKDKNGTSLRNTALGFPTLTNMQVPFSEGTFFMAFLFSLFYSSRDRNRK